MPATTTTQLVNSHQTQTYTNSRSSAPVHLSLPDLSSIVSEPPPLKLFSNLERTESCSDNNNINNDDSAYYTNMSFETRKQKYKEILSKPIPKRNKKYLFPNPVDTLKDFIIINKLLYSPQKRAKSKANITKLVNKSKSKQKQSYNSPNTSNIASKNRRNTLHTPNTPNLPNITSKTIRNVPLPLPLPHPSNTPNTPNTPRTHSHSTPTSTNKMGSIPLFGRTVVLDRNKTTQTKRNTIHIENTSLTMPAGEWKMKANRFNHYEYTAQTKKRLKSTDIYYSFHDDFKLAEYIHNSGGEGSSDKIDVATLQSYTDRLIDSSDIIDKNRVKKRFHLSSYRLYRGKLPATKCLLCHNIFNVIPLCTVGNGYLCDKYGEYKVYLYKIAILCSQWPACQFPLTRQSYSKYWVKTAYYIIRESNQIKKQINPNPNQNLNSNPNSELSVNVNKKKRNRDKDQENINNNSQIKRRKLNNNNMQSKSLNSYSFLRQVSNSILYDHVKGSKLKSKSFNHSINSSQKIRINNNNNNTQSLSIDNDIRSDMSTNSDNKSLSIISQTSNNNITL